MKKVPAHCSVCLRETKHEVLHETSLNEADRIRTYAMLQCCGCGDVCLAEQVIFTEDGEKEFNFYPPPVSRRKPSWLLSLIVAKNQAHLGGLLSEIYEAVHAGQNRLAAMGIRALLEQLMISKVRDNGSFERNLNAFQSEGYVSLVQRDTLNNVLQLGHGAIHRAFRPTTADLTLTLDIVEGVMAPIFHHQAAAEAAAEQVPPRPPPTKS